MWKKHFNVWIAILVQNIHAGEIEINKFVAQITPEWTNTQVIPSVGSLIVCNMKCERNQNDCNVFWFNKTTDECKLGHVDSLDVTGAGVLSFCKMSWFLVSITFQVRNVLTNGLLSGINVIAKAIQDEGDLFENETNENGEAHSQFMKRTEIRIELNSDDIFPLARNEVISNASEQTIVLLTFPTLRENEVKMMFSWGCCINDLDTRAKLFGDVTCDISVGQRTCLRGPNGRVEQTNDKTTYDNGQGEFLDWTGTFSNNDIHLIGLNGRGNTFGPNRFWNTGLNLTVIGGSEYLFHVFPKVESTNLTHWIVGCFKPSLGLASFREINIYANELTRNQCPLAD